MRRHEFEHVLKVAADIVKDELVVIGSRAVLLRLGLVLMPEDHRQQTAGRFEVVLARSRR